MSFSLSHALKSEFTTTIRQRGLDYFQRKLVSIKNGDQWTVSAKVKGNSRYDVNLKRDKEGVIQASCTCPYPNSSDAPCKHIYATLLCAEEKSYLQGNGDNSDLILDLQVNEDFEADYPDYENEDDEEEEEFIPTRYRSKRKMSEEVRLRILEAQKSRWGLTTANNLASANDEPLPAWKHALNVISRTNHSQPKLHPFHWPSERELIYIIDLPSMTDIDAGIVIEINYRERVKSGEWGKLKPIGLRAAHIPQIPDLTDQQILTFILGGREFLEYSYFFETSNNRYQISERLAQQVLPLACQTGRCWVREPKGQENFPLMQWEDGGAFTFCLDMVKHEDGYQISGAMRRPSDQSEINLQDILLVSTEGLLFTQNRISLLSNPKAAKWLKTLQQTDHLQVPLAQGTEFLESVLQFDYTPKLNLPPELNYEEIIIQPALRMVLRAHEQKLYNDRVKGELQFAYAESIVTRHDPRTSFYLADPRKLIRRNHIAEQHAFEYLLSLGFKEQRDSYNAKSELILKTNRVPKAIQMLLNNGWHVEAEGKLYRRPGTFNLNVSSGIDWFELHGEVDFEGDKVQLPDLLEALKHGQSTIQLGDGTFGLLPEEWLKKYGLIAATGEMNDDHIRFTKAQAGLLDALLAAQPDVEVDTTFANVRAGLKNFAGIEAQEPPTGFVGELRGYQKEALGWFQFLQKFGLGGCLADDMGLGKTPMTLALLETRRELRLAQNGAQKIAPTLIVVPKSLVFNWQAEAAKFTPNLKVLNHTGIEREKEKAEHFDDYDVILTTYGTLRNDAVLFKDKRFDYIVLDEAQAIKNANTESSKAARLLQADHKLALSGTPIENHLGELWSLFDFLNPGLLGASSVFGMSGNTARNPEDDTKKVLSQALRPFILRRTKSQVAKDLPPKLEQTIYCEMEPEQTKLYDEMRQHYRHALLGRIDQDGINKSKMHILEALLRLRQIACHPGLLDPKKINGPSAKLDVLLSQLAELTDEGHKSLVFSQFTSLLAIVREQLDKTKIPYEYLDGKTRNRQEKVERFQNDPACKLFLISLKAGGVGLNLTAADYVFLLDPWWNPAVEAQAIDRTHRIGQTKQVFAYRLITRGTVEEKVLQLQDTKRDLADAIISANNSVIRTLKREDLELLLS